ncbi:MAG TPA: hypothetical protein PLI95_27405, partial [Polyangiaceae bacterium]|nr:hypothetical protein [Polyangiaceae bacterium]
MLPGTTSTAGGDPVGEGGRDGGVGAGSGAWHPAQAAEQSRAIEAAHNARVRGVTMDPALLAGGLRRATPLR